MTDIIARQFADDAPKSNPWKDDALGFSAFSERLSEALVRQLAPRGYVFGLHGEWGAGKSTVLNFVRSYLEKWRQEGRNEMGTLQWFSFEPWVVSGHQDLAAAFFKVLSEKLMDGAERKAKIRRSARTLMDGSDKIIDAVATLGAAIDHSGGVASKAGATVAKLGLKKAGEKWLSEPSIQKTYHALKDRLNASGKRFIVFIDDIDRLTSEEIRSLMQMVKTVGCLPNVTYCLSYDRKIVWAALQPLAPSDGAHSGYAEKIVQHELEVPVPSRTGLMRMLMECLPEISAYRPSGLRWLEMQRGGITRWVRHPRDVVRLSNAMHFAWAALEGEIDGYDLLCMEALRLFDRKVFDWIRDNRDLLFGDGLPSLLEGKEKEADAEALGQRLREGGRADIPLILGMLFPNKAQLFGKHRGFSRESLTDMAARRGVATVPGYNAYFSLAPSAFCIPKRLLDRATGGGLTREEHRALIDRVFVMKDEQGNPLVIDYLQELGFRVDQLQPEDLLPLLGALIDKSVPIFELDQPFSYDASGYLDTLIKSMMELCGPELTADALDDIFMSCDSVGGLSSIYLDLALALGEISSDVVKRREYIEHGRLANLGSHLLLKIEAAYDAGELTDLPYYWEVARAWSHLGGGDGTRAWLSDEARRNGHTLAKVSRGLLNISTDENRRFSLGENVEAECYDIHALYEGCLFFSDADGLSDEEKQRIEALRSGLEKRYIRPQGDC